MLAPELQQLDIKSLSGFILLLEERSVSRAAARLYLSQSAMSRLLQRLRDAFNDPLFVRDAKGMQPTLKALQLEAPVRQMLTQVATLTSFTAFSPASSDRLFRLQTTHYQAQAYVPDIMEAFYLDAPKAALQTSTVTENSLLQSDTHNTDVVLCSEYIQIPAAYAHRLLGREKFCCIMSARHPLAQKETLTLSDYLNYRHVQVTMGNGNDTQQAIHHAFEKQVSTRQFALRTPYFLAALAAVGKTELLMTSSRLLAEKFSRQFGLTLRDLPFELPDIHYYLCWPKIMHEDPGNRWLRELCAQVVKNIIPYPYK